MTPLEIQIALTYHATANDFRDGDFTAPAVREAIDKFRNLGLLRARDCKDVGAETIYVATDRLHVYCNKLKTIGLPNQAWVYDEN